MKLWAFRLLLLSGLAVPAFGQDEKKDEDKKDVKEQAVKDGEKDPESEVPIRRLAEMRIDEFVVPARMIDLPLPGRTKTLQDIMDRFDEWSKDDQVGAVLLDLGGIGLSLPDVQELRTGIIKLRNKNKKVMSFLNGGGPEAYLLACSADEIAMPPTGDVMIPGLGRVFPFMKGYYQMMGMEFDVIAAGRFKYPGFVNEREPNQFFLEEFNEILDGWINEYVGMIAKSRKLPAEKVVELINTALFSATQAQQAGLVDTLAYYDDYRERLLSREKMKRLKEGEGDWSGVNSIQDMVELINKELKKTEEARKAVGPKIAVLHARGPIIDQNLGAAMSSMVICRDDFAKVVDELRKNDSIKAVVMRVDSPGGSGYASDVIWKHLRELADTKPLIVSMGSVAGSGGYYIACPAHRIFAQPTTITGSIGVLGMFQSAWSMFNRMDYELTEMKRGARSTLGSVHRTLSKDDRQFIQEFIDDFYDIFIDRVAITRKMPADQVHKIAEGRIYTGRQALAIGLVDELGGLPEAIESARGRANIPPSAELKIVHYPRPSSLGELLESFSMVGMGNVEQMLEACLKGASAAPSISFDQQLRMFSRRVQPLCWMAVPEFYSPTAVSDPWMQMAPRLRPESVANHPALEALLNAAPY